MLDRYPQMDFKEFSTKLNGILAQVLVDILGCFFKCIQCHFSVNQLSSLPLCRNCYHTLILCPPLCPFCGTSVCLANTSQICLFPWREKNWIHSYSGGYLMTDSSFFILRKWQHQNSYLLNRVILNLPTHLWTTWKNFQPSKIIILAYPAHLKSKKLFQSFKQEDCLLSTEKFISWLRQSRNRFEPSLFSQMTLLSKRVFLKGDLWIFETQKGSPTGNVLVMDLFAESSFYQFLIQDLKNIQDVIHQKIEKIHVFRMGIHPTNRQVSALDP